MIIETTFILELIRDRLDDLRLGESISDAIFVKKSSYGVLVSALNRADISICAEEKVNTEVAVFVGAGSKMVILEKGFYPKHENTISLLSSSIVNTNPSQLPILLSETSPLDVVEVISSEASVSKGFPQDDGPTEFLPFLSYDRYQSRGSRGLYFDRSSRKVWLTSPFETAHFIVFKAQIIPCEIDLESLVDEDVPYRIHAPGYTRDLLIERTLMNLLPAKVAAEQGIIATENRLRSDVNLRRPGSGARVYIPEGSYGWG